MSSTEITAPKVTALKVEQATEIAQFYDVPQSLVNMFFVEFNGVAYAKEPFMLYQAHKKGVQRIEVTVKEDLQGEWEVEARIYPLVTSRTIEALTKLPEKERREMWAYLTAPTVERGRASKENVKMPQMHIWLREIAVKRAVCRAARLFSGWGGMSFEELPEVVLNKKEVEEAQNRLKQEEHQILDVEATTK